MIALPAYAKPKFTAVNSYFNTTFTKGSGKVLTLYCGTNSKGKIVAGLKLKQSGGQDQIKSAAPDKSLKAKNIKKFKQKKKLFKQMKAACAAGDGGGGGGGGGALDLMLPLASNPTLGQIKTLTARAGFGYGSNEQVLAGIAGQGVQAVVDKFLKIGETPSCDSSSVQKYYDEEFDLDQSPTVRGLGMAYAWAGINCDHARERFFEFLLSLWTVAQDRFNTNNFTAFINYLEYLRSLAYGSKVDAEESILAIGRHAGMLIYLDNNLNLAGAPNENYAREFMELFLVDVFHAGTGQQNYTETDVQQIARAFTGWQVDQVNLSAVYNVGNHATGSKTIFAGTSAEATVDNDGDVVSHFFSNSKLRNTMAYKFAREMLLEYVTPNYSTQALAELATVILNNDFDLLASLRVLLASKYFYSVVGDLTINQQQFVLSVVNKLGIPVNDNNLNLDELVSDLEDANWTFASAPTVFYFDHLEHVNRHSAPTMIHLVNWLTENVKDGHDDWSICTNGVSVNSGTSAQDVINQAIDKLGTPGVELSSEQNQVLLNLLNSNSVGSSDTWNPNSSSECRDRAGGVLRIIALLNQVA